MIHLKGSWKCVNCQAEHPILDPDANNKWECPKCGGIIAWVADPITPLEHLTKYTRSIEPDEYQLNNYTARRN